MKSAQGYGKSFTEFVFGIGINTKKVGQNGISLELPIVPTTEDLHLMIRSMEVGARNEGPHVGLISCYGAGACCDNSIITRLVCNRRYGTDFSTYTGSRCNSIKASALGYRVTATASH